MILLPDDLRAILRANAELGAHDEAFDPAPVVKFVNPLGQARWLASELYADDDTMFGLADLGMGFPELGEFSLSELASIRLPHRLGIERDYFFRGRFPLSVYAEAARRTGTISEAEGLLREIAATLRKGDSELPPPGG